MLAQEKSGLPEASATLRRTGPKRRSTRVTEARALAQRAKQNTQTSEHTSPDVQPNINRKAKMKGKTPDLQAKRRTSTTIARAIEDYLQDHEGGNHSDKTLEWHRTAWS